MYFRNVPTKIKKNVSKKQKKVTTSNKAVQTVLEEKIVIEAEDLTSKFKIIFHFFSYIFKNQNINLLLKYFFRFSWS